MIFQIALVLYLLINYLLINKQAVACIKSLFYQVAKNFLIIYSYRKCLRLKRIFCRIIGDEYASVCVLFNQFIFWNYSRFYFWS